MAHRFGDSVGAFFAFLSIATQSLLFSQAHAATENAAMELQAGAVILPDPALGGKIRTHFNFAVREKGLTFLPDTASGVQVAGIFSQVVVFDSLGKRIDSASNVIFSRRSVDTPAGSVARVYNRLPILLAAGTYTAELAVTDITSKLESVKRFERFSLPVEAPNRVRVSGIDVAHSIYDVNPGVATVADPLVLHGMRVISNPAGVFSLSDTSFYIYCELYNLNGSSARPETLQYTVSLIPRGETEGRVLAESRAPVTGASAVIARKLRIQGSAAGTYALRFVAHMTIAATADTTERLITFIDDDLATRVMASTDPEKVSDYDTTSALSRMNMTRWLLSSSQREMIKSLSEEGRAALIERFWNEHDPTPGDGRNEYRDDVVARYLYANSAYSTGKNVGDGWRTDRGRVLLIYGAPDEIADAPAPTISNDLTGFASWERWSYNTKSLYFIFAEDVAYGGYKLLHSNAPGEKFDHGIDDRVRDIFINTGK